MTDLYPMERLSEYMEGATLELLNQLPVKLYDFATLSGTWNRAYGVHTVCQGDGIQDRQWLNQCVRYDIWQQLYAIQQNLFKGLGNTLTKMYLREVKAWQGRSIITTDFLNVSEVNKTRVYTPVGTGTIVYLTGPVTLTNNGQFVEGTISANEVYNPLDATFREQRTNQNAVIYEVKLQQDQDGYPFRSGSNWVYAMRNDVNTSKTIWMDDCEYCYIEINPVSGKNIKDIVFMHPSQNQHLRYERSAVVAGKWRYSFFKWVLKRPEVDGEAIDLRGPRPYDYLYSELPYGYYTDVFTAGIARFRKCRCCSEVAVVEVPFVLEPNNRKEGQYRVVLIKYKDAEANPPTYVELCCPPDEMCEPFELEYHYVTDPTVFSTIPQGTEQMRKGIVAKAAASLTMVDCGCTVALEDYIGQMQKPLPDVMYSPVNMPMAEYRYGNKYGDKEYEVARQRMKRTKKKGYLR